MAEFSRKSRSKRILENINTAKSSKRDVYNFYERWRKQYGIKGKSIDFAKSNKADIVRELYKLEAYQGAEIKAAPIKLFEKQYKQAKELPAQKATVALQKLQKKAERLEKAGKLSKQQANIFRATTQQPAPRKKDTISSRRTQRKNTYYKGRYAHDYIKKMVDDSIINDTDDFDDSQEIWYALDLIETNGEDFNFFEEHYAGNYTKGSRDYYIGEGGFEDFLRACDEFERDMQQKEQPIPERRTQAYWDALAEWLRGRSSTQL